MADWDILLNYSDKQTQTQEKKQWAINYAKLDREELEELLRLENGK